jgi:hypothetical protein
VAGDDTAQANVGGEGTKMTLTPDIDIYGTREAAEYLGMSMENFRIRLWRSRHDQEKNPLPEPAWILHQTRHIWTREQLDEWRESR